MHEIVIDNDDPHTREDLIGLARVSTDAQELARQIYTLTPLPDAPRSSLHRARHQRRHGRRAHLHRVRGYRQFQRQQIVKGIREGFDAARARGCVGGRPRSLTPEQIDDARILLAAVRLRYPSPRDSASPGGRRAAHWRTVQGRPSLSRHT
ncbi:hypothetical protein [Streptosporangium vulgare]|uniref:hypothetical protein n=1 Tax=Streptosporangium vulgare TaxID=46190 RepID=UPI0031DA1797